MSLATSRALIPLSTGTLTTSSHGALIHGSLSDPATGRTLHQLYSRASGTLEKQANRAAHRWGLGPCALVQRIEVFFGTGEGRMGRLEELRAEVSPSLKKGCSKLIAYTLPQESARTQVQAFKSIVIIATRYPGARALLLQSTHFRRSVVNQRTISALWARGDGSHTPDWDFHCDFAASCLSDSDISGIIADTSPADLSSIHGTSGSLTVTERLLVASECGGSNPFSGPLALRYLGGVLELPTFWLEGGPVHGAIMKKILIRLEFALRDLGLDAPEVDTASNLAADFEGVDFLAVTILTGICGLDNPDIQMECWYDSLGKVVCLLRGSGVGDVLPKATGIATSSEVTRICPDTDVEETMEILELVVDGDHFTSPLCDDDMELLEFGDRLTESVQDLCETDRLSAEFAFRWKTFGRGRRWAWGPSNRPELHRDRAPSSQHFSWIRDRFRNLFYPPSDILQSSSADNKSTIPEPEEPPTEPFDSLDTVPDTADTADDTSTADDASTVSHHFDPSDSRGNLTGETSPVEETLNDVVDADDGPQMSGMEEAVHQEPPLARSGHTAPSLSPFQSEIDSSNLPDMSRQTGQEFIGGQDGTPYDSPSSSSGSSAGSNHGGAPENPVWHLALFNQQLQKGAQRVEWV
ncbi:hypothetical protein FB451DRAFT_1227311 [Mycena latifolia]|nr:hypothetical protein FB451DRAFT_1227311 [Mycena latifolia]